MHDKSAYGDTALVAGPNVCDSFQAQAVILASCL